MFTSQKKINLKKLSFILSAIVIFGIYQAIYMPYLDAGKFHYDFQSALSRLIFGKIWFLKNGLSTPWFTPHICCGAPFYANPQSEFYSPIQFFFLFLKPLTTFKLFFVTYSFLAFVGTFLVIRKIFNLSYLASLIGSSLFLFNHYFAFHYLSGHIEYALIVISPIFFYFSAISFDKSNNKYSSLFFLIVASLIFATMMHSGGSRIIMEILISIFFLTLLHMIKFRNFKIFLFVGVSVLIGLIISSSKIYAAWSFIQNVSRDVEPIYFNSIIGFISTFLDFFFFIPNEDIVENFGSQTATLSIEEFSFNITVLPLIILFFYLRTLPTITKDKISRSYSAVLFLCIFVLILLNFSNTSLGAYARKIPFIANDWISFRMLAPLIILFTIISAIIFDKIKFKNRNLITFIFISIIILQNLFFDRDKLHKIFVHTALKDLFNHSVTKESINDYNIDETIVILDSNDEFDGPKQHSFFLKNQSILNCYFTVFGYGLEVLEPIAKQLYFNKKEVWTVDKKKLITAKELGSKMHVYKGNPLEEKNGKLNFINPSCYINPNENDCDKNFLFKPNKKNSLVNFLNYKPFEFKQLRLQIFFNYLSVIVLFSTIFYLIAFGLCKIRLKKNPSRN